MGDVDPANIQGSIWPRLPHIYETLLFFKIKDLEEDGSYESFKDHLRELLKSNLIATGARCRDYFERHGGVSEARERIDTQPEERETFNAVNVSFSGKGTTKVVGPYDELKLRDLLHEKGMFMDLVFEGPDEPTSLAPEYQPPENWPVTNDNWRNDGVFIVVAQRKEELDATVKQLKGFFGITGDAGVDEKEASMEITVVKEGHVRNADGKAQRRQVPDPKDPSKTVLENLQGKEHFGFEDQISQPAIEGLDPPPKAGEPPAMPPGIFFVNRRGDNTMSPDWATDGSYLAFREIEEHVPEFNDFLKTESAKLETYNDGTGEKLAAHMMGRWKNGSPVALDTPTSQGQHPHANNFEFKSDYNHGSEIKCPIAAHIRKMRPRADLYVSKTGEANVSAEENFTNNTNVILRRSVTFGPELKPGEEKVKPSERPKRGIHFMCYQADLRNGFNLLITRWASNEVFAANSVQTRPGQDPLIAQRNRPDHPEPVFSVYGGDKSKELKMGFLPWVDQRGGDYFFTPSMKALQTVFVEEVP